MLVTTKYMRKERTPVIFLAGVFCSILSQNVVKFRFIFNRVFMSEKTPYKVNTLIDTIRLFVVKYI